MKNRIYTILLSLFIFLAISNTIYSANNYLRRFALLVGANNGGSDRVHLRYAESDATTVGHVMRKLGGIKAQDIQTLKQPSTSQLLRALWYFKYKIMLAKRNHERVEAIFYYSGHSNEHGLLLAGKLLPYKKIKKLIKDLPADIKIAILDSCASGSLIRLKGGKMRAPFIHDTSMKMKGTVFLTSSSHNEASQESDRIRGSFFTHYLISGLRGGADMTKDGRITLNEAYQFAYHQTLARTEKTLTGPQHPGYSVQMSGSGDVVLTDIRRSSTQLTFSKSMSGRISIRTVNNVFIAELNKAAGGRTRLGLEPGRYVITLQQGNKVKQSIVQLYRGSRKKITPYNFRQVAVLQNTRGKGKQKNKESAFGIINTTDLNAIGFFFGIIGNYTKQNMAGSQISFIYNVNNKNFYGLQFSFIFNYNGSHFTGIQSSLVYCYNVGNFSGFQEALFYCYNGGNFTGMQSSLFYNVNEGDFSGFQATLFANRNDGHLKGMQASLFLNITDSLNGLQAGLINISSGKVKGMQLGLINISGEADAPIGIFNFVKKGQLAINLWYDEMGMLNTGLKMGGKYTYSLLSAGVNKEKDLINLGISLGVRFPINKKIYFNVDTGSRFFISKNSDKWAFEETDGEPAVLSSTRCWLQFKLMSGLSLIGGVSFNMLFTDSPKVRPGHDTLWSDSSVKAWPGFFFGIQIF